MSESTSPAPPNVAVVLQRIDDSWGAFLTSLDDLTEDQLLEPNAVGAWSLKALLGHIAFWDNLGRENAALALSGQAREFDDFEALNQANYAARQGRTLAEERAAARPRRLADHGRPQLRHRCRAQARPPGADAGRGQGLRP